MDIVIIPDYNGESYLSITKELSALYEKKTILAALNGPLIQPSEKVEKINDNIHLIRTPHGYNNALFYSLKYALENNYQRIYKLDTAEHDPKQISNLANLLSTYDLVISDLSFTEETLPIHSHDYILNKITMPNLTSKYSKLRLKLSGAHGYFALTNKALKSTFPKITTIHNSTSNQSTWGLDTALMVEIVNSNLPYKVVSAPATLLRDRPLEKIEKQVFDTRNLLSKT